MTRPCLCTLPLNGEEPVGEPAGSVRLRRQASGLRSGISARPPQLYPDSGEKSLRTTKKKEEMNKRLVLAWKTLACCEPDGGGKAPRFESNVGGFCSDQERLGKCAELIQKLPRY